MSSAPSSSPAALATAGAPAPKSMAQYLRETAPPSFGPCRLRLLQTLVGHSDRVWCVAWHPSATLLASCGGDKSVRLWSRPPSDGPNAEWKCIVKLEGDHDRTVRSLSWSPDGNYLACSSFDAKVSIYKRATPQFDMELVSELDGHENEVKCVAFDPTGRCLATCSRDKTVWVWDKGGSGLATILATKRRGTEEEGETAGDEGDDNREYECAGVLTGHTQDVKCVRWVPGERAIVSCSYDDSIKIWEESPKRRDDWHCTQSLHHHAATVWCVSFQRRSGERGTAPEPPFPLFASCSDDATVALWEKEPPGTAEDGSGRWVLACNSTGVHERTIFSVDWAPPCESGVLLSTILATASGDDSIGVLELSPAVDGSGDTRRLSATPLVVQKRAHDSDVNCVAFAPALAPSDLRVGGVPLLCSCSDDNKIKLWLLEPVVTK